MKSELQRKARPGAQRRGRQNPLFSLIQEVRKEADNGDMKIKYNAPTTLTFAIASALILACDQYIVPDLISQLFMADTAESFSISNPVSYIRIFTHVLGHLNWEHLLSNMTLILLLGPILEEKYGSKIMAFMFLVTAGINGLINALFFPSYLLGASGIAFMMILLISFANIKQNEFPLSFFLVIFLYIVKEFINIFKYDDISQISHIVGACCGSIFGFTKTVAGKKGQPPGQGPPQPPTGHYTQTQMPPGNHTILN